MKNTFFCTKIFNLRNFLVILIVFQVLFSCQVSASEAKKIMVEEVTNWVSNKLKIPKNDFEIIPPDHRVKIRKCLAELSFDFPFDSKETVRIKCIDPNWHFFLRVKAITKDAQNLVRPRKTIKKVNKREEVYKTVLVAALNLNKGKILKKSDTTEKQFNKKKLPVDVYEKFSGLENFEVVREIKLGQPIRSQSLRPAKLIKKGNLVLMSILAQGMLVTATVEALQDGIFGEQIKLLNKESGQTVFGVVTGKNQVSGL